MSKRKTRERQLAKLAARREAERHRRRRQRLIAAVVALALAAGGAAFAFVVFLGGDEPSPTATNSPTASPSETASPSPTASPTPDVLPVACGAEVPATAKGRTPEFKKTPRLSVDTQASYVAALETSCGTITVELFPDRAPWTVNSFVFLTNEGYFDGLVFHRIANSIAVIQSGDPSCTGQEITADILTTCPGDERTGPGYTLPDETFNGLKFEVGTLAMANAGPGTTGSQFFIITGKKGQQLPPNYTIFGKIIGGLDVARKIQDIEVGEAASPEGEQPQELIYIERVTISIE